MRAHSRILFVFRLVMLLGLTAGSIDSALAQPTGRYDLLTFPSCTTWSISSTAGVNQPGPSNYVETMTDGNGAVVFSRSTTGGIGTFFLWGSGSFTVPPAKNPIHDFVVMDGVTIIDVFANDQCLPVNIPASSTPELAVLAALLSLIGMWAIRRKWGPWRNSRR